MAVKCSMAVKPHPIDRDGVEKATNPASYDNRWSEYNRKWEGPWGYIITRVTNSTAYRPGFLLTRAKVDQLIEDEWTITVLSNV